MVADRPEEWYTNKELYEQQQELAKEMAAFQLDLAQTREIILRYNGLRADQLDMAERLRVVEDYVLERQTARSSQNQVAQGIRDWGGWIVACIVGVMSLLRWGGGA